MLKQLLTRSKKEDDGIVEEIEMPEVSSIEEDEPEPFPVEAPKPAPQPTAPKIRRKRKAARSRASDVRDENGRSAEEIAAEANRDFDIMAVARRAAAIPETAKDAGVASTEVETPKQDAAAAPAALDASDPGHLVMPGADLDAGIQTQAARDAYWARWGQSVPKLIDYGINPQALGAPAWPATRQNFRLVRTETSLIIASEGLSDPFGPFSDGGTTNGFGLEVFLEVTGWQSMGVEQAKQSWAFAAIEHFSRVVAQARGLDVLLDQEKLLSIDLPFTATPDNWSDPDFPEMPGGLVGMALPPGLDCLEDTPLSRVRMVSLTMITPEELEACVIGGAEERQALATDLLTTGIGHQTVPERMSLR